ncbi:MAG: hypothetical protein ACAI35_14165 [Candidatus Methylacidiphilales bacterium]|nr:hypothetical protein [Candidatus Methylacidiphilales bacterium]
MLSRSRLVILLAVLFLLSVSGLALGIYYVFRGPVVTVENHLPAETLMLAYVPNAASSGYRFYNSNLYKVVMDKNAQDFTSIFAGLIIGSTGASMSKETQKELEEMGQLFAPVFTGESFFAVTGLNAAAVASFSNHRQGTPLPNAEDLIAGHLIAGVRPKQGVASAYDPFEQRLRERWERDKPQDIEMGTGTIEGIPYEYLIATRFGNNPIHRFIRVKLDGWVLFSLGEAPMADFIKRYNGTIPRTTSLASSANFLDVKKHLTFTADALTYINMADISKNLKAGITDRNHSDAISLLMDWTPAFGLSVNMEDGLIRDRYYYILPSDRRLDLGKFYEPCAYETARATTPNTLFYLAQSIDLKSLADRLPQIARQAGATGPAADPVRESAKMLAILRLDLEKNILNAVGNEVGCFVETGDKISALMGMINAPRPVAGVLFTVKDQPNFQPVVEMVLDMLKGIPGYKSDNIDSLSNGFEVTTLRYGIPSSTFINIGASFNIDLELSVITKGPFFGIITQRSTALKGLSNTGGTFRDTEKFKQLSAVELKGSAGLIYLNTPLLVDSYYPLIPAVMKLRGFIPAIPDITAIAKQNGIDLVIPDKLEFVQNVTAWLSTVHVTNDGVQMTSLSGVGNQGIVVYPTMIGAAGFVVSKLYSPPSDDDAPADVILGELQDVRRAIKTWTIAGNKRKGSVPQWSDIVPFLTPNSRLAKQAGKVGKDLRGNPFDLGIVGERDADVSTETKAHFPDKGRGYWLQGR